MKNLDPATFFDELARRRARTRIALDRPMELDPHLGTELDAGELADLVRRTAARLAAAGAEPGRHVAVLKRNHWDYVLLACAAARLGAVPALLSDRTAPDAQRTLLDRLEPAVLVTTAAVLGRARTQGVDLLRTGAATLTLDEPFDDAGFWFAQAPDRPAPAGSPPPVRPRGEHEPLIVNHTSGTTGVPKLVVHSTYTLIRRLAAFEATRWPFISSRARDTVASATSFAHGRALPWTLSILWLGPAKVAIVSDDRPESAIPFLRAHPPTTLEALPSTYLRWHAHAEAHEPAFHRIRLFINTFDAVHPPTPRAFLAASKLRHPVWLQAWGQSETGPLTFRFLTRRTLAHELRTQRPTTRDLGRNPVRRATFRVVDPRTFAPMPPGVPGLLLARTRARALGYVAEAERFTAKVHGNWFNTGDLGLRTRTGRIVLLDREVDMIPGGSCVEIEDLLHERLPQIQEAVVLSTTSGPPLPVLITDQPALDPRQWRAARRGLPELAEPRLLPWDEVPRTGTGKVRRHELREALLAGSVGHGTGRWT